ncbi:MAG: hypothetical protein ACI8PT_001023 [Gammaproteobacteria bacterium]
MFLSGDKNEVGNYDDVYFAPWRNVQPRHTPNKPCFVSQARTGCHGPDFSGTHQYGNEMTHTDDESETVKSFRALFNSVPHHQALGVELQFMSTEGAYGFIPYKSEMIGNPLTGGLHGGIITTLLDTIGGAAVAARLDALRTMATLDLRIDYLRPSTPQADIYAHVVCYKLTHNVAFARGTAYNANEDDPVASMSATYMLDTANSRRT